jgi:uncharacterized protein YgiM (DUF1202 family)
MNLSGKISAVWLLMVLTASAVVMAAAAAETGSTRSQADLFAAPYSDAKHAGKLDANTKVSVLERRGAWLRVTAADKRSGWVRMHQVRVGEGGATQKSGEGLSMLRNVAQTGRSGSSGIVATTGVRGLSAEELKNAKANTQALNALDSYRASPDSARQQARSGALKEQNVNFLGKPGN